MTQPRVFLVDDHELIRAGLKSALRGSVDVVGEADEVEPAIEMILERVPSVVLLDVHLPGGGGVAVLRAVQTHNIATRFLALSVSDAPQDVISIVRAGARGYVTKNIRGPELIDAIYRVDAGDVVFSPRLAGFVLDAFASDPSVDPAVAIVDPELDQLTPREQQVLRLIARGYAYKEIAGELAIAPKTVESHVSSVLRKLQLSNRHQLAHWANDRRLD
ncbi:MAG TPA: response regulator transcription factor [Acidimicrobiales bacterium]